MRSVALKEAMAEPTSEAKEAAEPFLEKLQQPPTSSALALTADEEEIVGLAWLLYLVDQGVVTWAI